jgi:predicted RNA-binding protein with PUA-like domain
MGKAESYLRAFISLKTASVSGKPAPHKAILLLSILDSISDGLFPDNHIVLTEDLESRFNSIWEEYSSPDDLFQPRVATPFWHLQGEPFYHLFFNDGTPATHLDNPYSVKKLRQLVYASFDEDLFELIKQESYREELQSVLIINYLEEEPYEDSGIDVDNPKDIWMLPSNANFFKIDDCLREVGHVYWRQHNNFTIGDLIYLYGTRPDSRIKYLMRVETTDEPFNERMNDKKYWVDPSAYEEGKRVNRFMKLSTVRVINSKMLSYDLLRRHGLKQAPQSPMRLSSSKYSELLSYIRGHENEAL